MKQILLEILPIIGLLTLLIGTPWFIINTFRQSILWGLACIFFPLAQLVFIVVHWDRAYKPFTLLLIGATITYALQ